MLGRTLSISIGKFTVRVGYCERVTAKPGMPPSLGIFVGSLTDEQFHHCLFKLENVSPKYLSTIKVIALEEKPFFVAFLVSKYNNDQNLF